MMNEQIALTPCESGYRVEIAGELVAHLMCRVWEAQGQVDLGCYRVAPLNFEAKCMDYPTLGAALDYALSTVRLRA